MASIIKLLAIFASQTTMVPLTPNQAKCSRPVVGMNNSRGQHFVNIRKEAERESSPNWKHLLFSSTLTLASLLVAV
jgi:hypothetical protein